VKFDMMGEGGILQQLRDGGPIAIDKGTFKKGGLAVYWTPLVDSVSLVTSTVQYLLFSTPVGQTANGVAKTDAATNMPSTQVPGGERWDLMGISFFALPVNSTGANWTEANQAAFRVFVQSASYTIRFNNQVVRQVPLFYHFGNKGYSNNAVSTTLALTTPDPVAFWHETWPEECYLPMQENISMKFSIDCAATAAGVNGFVLGVAFDRVVASLTP